MEQLQFYASYYYSLGMNVAPIYAKSKGDDFKAPQKEIFEEWRDKRQDVQDVMAIDWQSASGLGLITGVNNLRVIDIDNILPESIFDEVYNPDLNFLPELLKMLGLPEDYHWVIKSGSHKGLHIVIDIDDIPNINNNVFSVASHAISCDTDILWHLFSVLPPSLHKSGNKYSFFFNNNLPQYKPQKVSIDSLYKMLLKYSGRCASKIFTYQTHNIEFRLFYLACQESKTCSIDGEEHLCQATIERCPELLERTTDGLNKLGVDCFLKDYNKAINYFNRCDNDFAKLNIIILKSLGLIECTFEDLCLELSKIKFNNDIKSSINDLERSPYAAEELFSSILEHGSKFCKKPNRLFFFDTETSALPTRYDVLSRFLNNWPRLVQIAWIVADTGGNIFDRKKFVIKPNGFEISKEAVAIHGITQDYAMNNGTDIKTVLSELLHDMNLCHAIVCHNVDFDKRVVGAEMIRCGFGDFMDELPAYCTMKLSTPYCKIPSQYSSYSYKYPKLSELYRTLFNEDFQDAHNAESDIHATLRCYFELVARGVIEKCNKNETLGVLNVRLSEKNRTMEEEAWECCTTIKACEEYLRIYPFGIHVADIEEKLDDLTFNSCKSIKNYGEYLKRFIQGKHIEDAECRMFKLCKIDYDFEQFLRFRPNGKYAIEAERALDDRNWGKRSNFWGYKKYLKEYPKGVHSKEAEGLVRNTKKWFLICSVSLVILGIHIAAALFSDSFWDGFFIPAYVECTLLILCCGILIYDGILYLWEKFLSIFKIF